MANVQQIRNNLVGRYQFLSKSYLQHTSEGFQLLLTQNNNRQGKPQRYLLYIDQTGKRRYVSSLYPAGDPAGDRYCFDYACKYYMFDIQGNIAEVTECKQCQGVIRSWSTAVRKQ